jgi:sugar phosphate isomerase/epimerase
MYPISIQPYTLREQIKADGIWPVLERVAKIGYTGLEVGDFGGDAAGFRARLEGLGMAPSSRTVDLPNQENAAAIIDTSKALGVTNLMIGFWKEEFANLDAIEKAAERVNMAIDALDGSGLRLCMHNHWFEFEVVAGRYAMDHLMALCPEMLLEVDIYWASNFGANDPSSIIEARRSKIPLLHIKDGPLQTGMPHLALGDGKVDIRAAIDAADPNVLQWLVVELDEFDGDMWQAVERSYEYLERF